jgi:hypothetical protein
MTQPPGPYGRPGPYEPPMQPGGAAPYGPPVPFGQPGPYAGQGGYGPPPQPPRNDLLPWLIVGGAVLVSGLGILLVVLLGRGDDPAPQSQAPSSTPEASSSATAGPTREAATGDLPGGARVADEDTGADRARYPGSGDVALAWVQAMAAGEFQTAYQLSCPEVQDAATAAADGGDPARELGTYFFEQTLGGQGFTDGTFDSVIYDEDSRADIASFTLQLDDGAEFLLLVYVQSDGTVCDFV